MKFYFGHKTEITNPYDIETEWMIKNKPPLVRSQLLTQRLSYKRRLVRRELALMLDKEIKQRLKDETRTT